MASIENVPLAYRSIFSQYREFNEVQSRAFEHAFNSGECFFFSVNKEQCPNSATPTLIMDFDIGIVGFVTMGVK